MSDGASSSRATLDVRGSPARQGFVPATRALQDACASEWHGKGSRGGLVS